MITIPDKSAWDARVKQISKWPKQQLRFTVYDLASAAGRSWVMGGPQEWSKDELISFILDAEGLQVPGCSV
jgi:hypothetical protein